MTTDAIMDRLRKLVRHEESAREIGSLAEAEAFAGKIQQLLIEHKLEVAEVMAGDDHDEERREEVEQEMYDPRAIGIPYNGRARVAWLERLASTVARAHFCRIVVRVGSVVFWFVGTATDRLIAGNVFAALVRGAIAACDAEYAKARRDPWATTDGFRRSFYAGFVAAIATRMQTQRAAADATTTTALVLANADGAVQKYIAQKYTTHASGIGRTAQHNAGAYANGKAHGSRASINTAIGGNSRKGINS